ncbi:MAG: hypothetical protein ABR583_14570 [Gaiellaceae bacterium]
MSPWLIPLFVLAAVVVLFLLLVILGRVAGGKYLRPIMTFLARLPLIGRGIRKASQAALERQNPELASAVRKLERMNATTDPRRAQQALSQLTANERRAYMDAVQEQDAPPEGMNRAQRRQLERARKRR